MAEPENEDPVAEGELVDTQGRSLAKPDFREEINRDLIGYLRTQISRANNGTELQKEVENKLLERLTNPEEGQELSEGAMIKILEVLHKSKGEVNASILGVLKETQKVQINNFGTGADGSPRPMKQTDGSYNNAETEKAKRVGRVMRILDAIESGEVKKKETEFFEPGE